MTDRRANRDFMRLQPCRRLVSLQRLVLPQEARRGGGCGDPALRIIRFDRAQIPRGSLGLV